MAQKQTPRLPFVADPVSRWGLHPTFHWIAQRSKVHREQVGVELVWRGLGDNFLN